MVHIKWDDLRVAGKWAVQNPIRGLKSKSGRSMKSIPTQTRMHRWKYMNPSCISVTRPQQLHYFHSGPSTFLNLQILGFQRSNAWSSMCSRKRNLILHFPNSNKWIARSSKFKSNKTSKLGWRSIFLQIIL